MGVTIHFEGKLKSDFEYEKIMLDAKAFAEANKMEHEFFTETEKLLLRHKDGEEWDYSGPTKGIRIQPHDNTDPLLLEFDENNYIQEYCKTQFADIAIHIKIVEFLKSVENYFDNLKVNDEGEYWQTADKGILQNRIDTCFYQIETLKQNDPTLDGPYKTEGDRIVDLLHA
ncbi:hypothetical protein SLW70_13535 [Flavobacterium sp. NG2]|uniref:hypothetical protein n=1 Tax=Flavobacterium sp. NG2 TaxID=3097547 RepID=UPI002A7FDFE0|nr:hypothetical protein [Flavobacterium sp. NG2]WPR70945.1 hypothetical protein SLW70_13535 [Flavobacterium sp. NG2]